MPKDGCAVEIADTSAEASGGADRMAAAGGNHSQATDGHLTSPTGEIWLAPIEALAALDRLGLVDVRVGAGGLVTVRRV